MNQKLNRSADLSANLKRNFAGGNFFDRLPVHRQNFIANLKPCALTRAVGNDAGNLYNAILEVHVNADTAESSGCFRTQLAVKLRRKINRVRVAE